MSPRLARPTNQRAHVGFAIPAGLACKPQAAEAETGPPLAPPVEGPPLDADPPRPPHFQAARMLDEPSVPAAVAPPFALTRHLRRKEGGVDGLLADDTGLFDRTTLERFCANLV